MAIHLLIFGNIIKMYFFFFMFLDFGEELLGYLLQCWWIPLLSCSFSFSDFDKSPIFAKWSRLFRFLIWEHMWRRLLKMMPKTFDPWHFKCVLLIFCSFYFSVQTDFEFLSGLIFVTFGISQIFARQFCLSNRTIPTADLLFYFP